MQGEVGSAETGERDHRAGLSLHWLFRRADGLIVRVALPLEEVQDRLDRSRLGMFLVGLAVAAVGLLVVWLVARRLAAPIEKLTASVDRIAEGDLETRVPPSRVVEVERLGSAFNHMAEQLGARLEEADQERARRDLVLATLDSGVVLIEPDDAVAYANKAAARPDRPDSRGALPTGPPPAPGAGAGGAGVGGAGCRRDPSRPPRAGLRGERRPAGCPWRCRSRRSET